MEKPLIDIFWVIICAAIIFLMQGGFLCLEAGLTRSKNSINVAVKNLTDFGISLLLFWIFGFAWMFGMSHNGWIGTTHYFAAIGQGGAWLTTFFIYQSMFCGTAVTIISGGAAERMRFTGYIIVSVIVSGLIYPLFGHWAWGGAYAGGAGWLADRGFVDFAGATVVHSVGGWVVLATVIVLGARAGRFSEEGEPQEIPGSNLPIAMLGVFLMWFGWIGFNGGSTFALNENVPGIIANTMLSAGAGMLFVLFLGWRIEGYPDPRHVINGSLAGLVAITANCHAVTAPQAIIIGCGGGLAMFIATKLLEHFCIDDVVGAFPVHAAAGIWGTLAVGLFGDLEILGTGLSRGGQITVQLFGIGVCALFSFGTAFILLSIINRVFPLRVSAQDERDGLNVSEHNATTETYNLFRALEKQRETKDLTLRVPEEPFTEVGQIARCFNAVMDALERALGQTDAIVKTAKDAIVTFLEKETIITGFNPAAEVIFGYSSKEAIGQPVTMLLDGDKNENLQLLRSSTQTTAHDQSQKITGHRADGTSFPMEVNVATAHVQDSEFHSAMFRDITEREKTEEALRESFREISNTTHDAIIIIDSESNVSYWNRSAERIFGYTKEEIMGKPLHDLLAPERYRKEANHAFSKFKKNGEGPLIGKTREIEALRKDGTEFPIELSVSSIKLRDCWQAVGIIRDITERKQIEKELAEKLQEMERFHNLAVGREKRVMELKIKINKLSKELGREAPHDESFLQKMQDVTLGEEGENAK